MNVELVVCPTQREHDGLAMSSRNLRLNEQQRRSAPHIFRAMLRAKDQLLSGNHNTVEEEGASYLASHGFSVDYFKVVSANDLAGVEDWKSGKPVVVLTAAFLGEVRLIDNLVVTLTEANS
jgi:pantoate--beta-alanine ligase